MQLALFYLVCPTCGELAPEDGQRAWCPLAPWAYQLLPCLA